MSATNIRRLKNRHRGDTIYVIGSGASVDHVDRAFLEQSVSVGINEIFRHVKPTYVLSHHHESMQEAIDAGYRVVVSETDWGADGWGTPSQLRGDYFTYRTDENTRDGSPRIDVEALAADTVDSLVVSPCTTSEALQFAAHLGAATIICCGLDGAALDGRWCVDGYCNGAQTNPQHIRLTQPLIAATLAALRTKGVRIYSLSPFVGAQHEGHVYTLPKVLEGFRLDQALRRVNWQQRARA